MSTTKQHFYRIEFPASEDLRFIGRNGAGKCKGVEVYDAESHVELAPITSKGNVANCLISLPREAAALAQVVLALNTILLEVDPAYREDSSNG